MIKAMIVSVGGTPAPILKSITEHRPEFVSFFASQDTFGHIQEVKKGIQEANVSIKNEVTLADDVNDLCHCFDKAEEAVKRAVSKGLPQRRGRRGLHGQDQEYVRCPLPFRNHTRL